MKLIFPFFILCILSKGLVAQYGPCNLPKPQNLFITHEVGCNTVLHWDSVPGASFYGVKHATASDTVWIIEPQLVTTNSFSFQGLSPITAYTFAVAAFCDVNSPSGFEKLDSVTDAVCEAPQNVIDSVKNNSIKFSWFTCWNSSYNQLRYRFITDSVWTYVSTNVVQHYALPIPHNGTIVYQINSCPDTTNSWSMIDSIYINIPPTKPNQLVIILDDMRYDTYSCNGGPAFFQSQNLDRIATEGVNFKNSFVVFSLCNPSRSSILTGLYANHHGAYNNKSMFYSYLPTIGTVLNQAGYYTAFLGKYLNANEDNPVPQPGWDYWLARIGSGHIDATFNFNGAIDSIPGHVTDVLTDTAVALINRTVEPFLIYLCYTTHPPWVPRRQDARLYQNAQIELPDNYYRYSENYPSFLTDSIYTAEDSALLIDDIRHYYQVLAGVDKDFGKILSALDGKGILDSTLILFTSDNGYLLGEHLLQGKRLPKEESERVPMFIRYPKWFPEGSIITSEMVLNVDIAPTLFELAGVPDTIPFDGVSMHKIFQGTENRNAFYYQGTHLNDSADNSRSVRSFYYKYDYYYCDNLTEEFFDLINDPHEDTNLINDKCYQNLIQEYRLKLDSFKHVYGDSLIEAIRPCHLAVPVYTCNDTILPKNTLLVLYPNPTSGLLHLRFPDGDSSENADLVIYNMQGVIVFQLNQTLILPGYTLDIDLSSLTNGVYDVQILFRKKTFNSKLIIMK